MITEVIRADAERVVTGLGRLLEPLSGSRVVITGAAGFLGSFFLDVLDAFNAAHSSRPAQVIAIDNAAVGKSARLDHLTGRTWLARRGGDISREADLMRLLDDGDADWIIHCASIASPIYYRADPLATIAANVQGTWNMLELARRSKASGILSMSSSEVYGDPKVVPTPEDYWGYVSFTGPRACYDESKRLGETLCETYYRLHQVPIKVVRPFNVYGPGQRLNDGRIIPDLMSAALAGGPLVLYSDGQATRSFCYVADFVRACLTLLMMPEANGEAFNVGHDQEVSIAEVAHQMADVAATPPLQVEMRASADETYLTDNPRRRCPDLGKLKRLTGFTPEWDLREGLARTLASYRQMR